MKRRLNLLLTALLLALALTACGSDMGWSEGTGGDWNDSAAGDRDGVSKGERNDGVIGGNSSRNRSGTNAANGRTGSIGGDLADDARDALTGAEDLVEDAMDGSAVRQNQGVDYRQMVRNGQIHDRDGDLTDMENSVTPGKTHF